MWRKGEYIGTKGWTGGGNGRKVSRRGMERGFGARRRKVIAGAVNVDDDDDDDNDHHDHHWYRHTCVCVVSRLNLGPPFLSHQLFLGIPRTLVRVVRREIGGTILSVGRGYP